MKRVLLFVLMSMQFLSACGSKVIEVHEPWARNALKGENGVVYMTLHNHTSVNAELLGASSDAAQAVEIHESRMSDDGVMQMIPQDSVPLAAGEEVEFKPGGLHIMLVDLNQDLVTGDHITLTLHFANYADITLSVPVQDATGMDDSHHMP
jgi:copper(I)-binding protein